MIPALILLSAVGLTSCNKAQTPAEGTPNRIVVAAQQPEPRAEDFDPKPGTPAAPKVDGAKAYKLLKDFVALGPRPIGSAGHKKAEQFILDHLKGAEIQQDQFTANTAAGPFPMNNIIAKFPGKKDGIIVIAGHYDTNLPLKDKNFVGANDGGSNVGLMLTMADEFKQHPPEGYSIWLVFTDGEEATKEWTDEDSVYGSKHLAAAWSHDGTAAKVKAFLLLDMIGDKDLDIQRDTNSSPWLLDVIYRAATRLGVQSHFFARQDTISDDHLPYRAVGIPVADIIDIDYGFQNLYHHTTEDTPDKCSPESLTLVGNVVMETIRALNTR